MIETLYSLNTLDTNRAFLLALLLGGGFGFALERAGFSSSRRLAGVFYLVDMAVVKVMFSAMVTATLGLSCCVAFGWVTLERIFLMPTIYAAQIVGGLLFGVGFAMGAWCPGTAAAGLAAGRIDALVFLLGSVGGSILFNEAFPLLGGLYTGGDRGVRMVYDELGLSRGAFALILTVAAVGVFWLVEWVAKVRRGRSDYWGSPFLKAFSVALVSLAAGLALVGQAGDAAAHDPAPASAAGGTEADLLAAVEAAEDHVEPEELADALMAGAPGWVVVDVRPPAEFAVFHIRGALNVPLPALAEALQPYRKTGRIVLYSNGMTHPAQARDSLQRQGYRNVLLLTDGLDGFRERCLKPVSLRREPLPAEQAARINAWRAFFATPAGSVAAPADLPPASTAGAALPAVVDTDWLAAQLGTIDVAVIDLRPQPEYNRAHIPGSLSLQVESLRGNVGGVPSMLLPADLLAAHFSLLGLRSSQRVVLVYGDKLHDATLAGMALLRVGHANHAILGGGYTTWASEGRPVDAALPTVAPTTYQAKPGADTFAIGTDVVAAGLGKPSRVVIDVRPADYYAGAKSDEARAGHIPGAINRPFTADVVAGTNQTVRFQPSEKLAAAYAALIPSRDTEVIVHCRTGHQGSQTFFVLTRLLGYTRVRWFDAGWTEWAARPEFPVAMGDR